jgi:hypothetical protein
MSKNDCVAFAGFVACSMMIFIYSNLFEKCRAECSGPALVLIVDQTFDRYPSRVRIILPANNAGVGVV